MVSLQKLPLSRYKHSETDDIRSKYGAIYGVFYGSILTPRISGGFNACADSVYQALFSAYEKEPGVEARCSSDVAVGFDFAEFARKIKGVACVIVRSTSTSRPARWPARVRNAVG